MSNLRVAVSVKLLVIYDAYNPTEPEKAIGVAIIAVIRSTHERNIRCEIVLAKRRFFVHEDYRFPIDDSLQRKVLLIVESFVNIVTKCY